MRIVFAQKLPLSPSTLTTLNKSITLVYCLDVATKMLETIINYNVYQCWTQVTWGCEGKRAELETDKDGRKFYYAYPIKGKKKKIYCKYDSRQSLETAIMEKRTSLKRAIEIYMEEVAILF